MNTRLEAMIRGLEASLEYLANYLQGKLTKKQRIFAMRRMEVVAQALELAHSGTMPEINF